LDNQGNGPYSTPLDMSWVDPGHYLTGPVTDANGVIKMLALVPGLQYQIRFGDLAPRAPITAPFKVAAANSVQLPDMVSAPATEDEEFARPPGETQSKTSVDPDK
jgi:hypothetical protein